MPSNGELNSKFGIYRALCCGEEIVITVGATFPDCPKHPRLSTKWKAVVESDGVIKLSEVAAKKNKSAA